jgi:hypothetical protein
VKGCQEINNKSRLSNAEKAKQKAHQLGLVESSVEDGGQHALAPQPIEVGIEQCRAIALYCSKKWQTRYFD